MITFLKSIIPDKGFVLNDLTPEVHDQEWNLNNADRIIGTTAENEGFQ